MGQRWLVPAVMFLFLAVGCTGKPVLVGDRSARLDWHPRYHTVKRGDTLYSIAWTYGQDYRLIAQWNGLAPPYTIYPGRRIRIAPPPDFAKWRGRQRNAPENDAKRGGRRPSSSVASSKVKVYPRRREADTPASGRPLPLPKADSSVSTAAEGTRPIEWQWPVSGKPRWIKGNTLKTRSGIDIRGRRGQPVYAAAAGKVVYSGSGLIGYGKLIILKHNNQYLSAYAHNWELLVKEGEQVAKGVQIARMGSSGTDEVKLHFEIRRDGKPVDPLRYLPKY